MYGDANNGTEVNRPKLILFESRTAPEAENTYLAGASVRQTPSRSILEKDLHSIAKYATAIGVAQPFGSQSMDNCGLYGHSIRPRLSHAPHNSSAHSQALDARSIGGVSKRSNYNDGSSSTGHSSTRYPRRPVAPESHLRTDFTTVRGNTNSITPQQDFDPLATPSGEPPQGDAEEFQHPALLTIHQCELTMRVEYVLIACALGMGIGAAISGHTSALVTYWITTIGDLFIRTTACLVLPLVLCQVIISTAELVNNKTLRLAWKSLMSYLLVITIAAVWCMLVLTISFRTVYQRMEPPQFKLKHAPFAFRCSNNKYIEQQHNGSLTCTGSGIAPNTTFPYVVDVHQHMGIEQAVGNVDLSGYTMALLNVYFPKNIIQALAKDNTLSSLIVAAVVGTAVGLSYTSRPGTIKSSNNPLFRLLTHVYLSLYTILEWIQVFALWFTIPIMMGAVLAIPDLWRTLHTASIYLCVLLLGVVIQMFVIAPFAFYLVTRENPYKWMRTMSVPVTYAFIFNSPFLPMLSTTNTAIRSGQIDPALFGALYPIMSVLNTTGCALDLPNALMYVAEFSGCTSEMTTTRSFLFFGTTLMASFGETTLPQSGLTLFLTMWRSFCQDEDTPGAVVLLTLIGVITHRLAVAVNAMTNLMLIRMVSFKIEEYQSLADEQTAPSPLSSASIEQEMVM